MFYFFSIYWSLVALQFVLVSTVQQSESAALPAGGFGSVHTPSPEALCKDAWLLGPKGRRELS